VTATLDNPGAVIARLRVIEDDLALRQNTLESAALAWFKAKRDKEHARAVAFIKASGTVAERNALADQETALMGRLEEAEYAAVKAVVRTLETRSNIGMALLKSHGRVGFS
jgi:hypothetical protein